MENIINTIFSLSTYGCHGTAKPVVHSFHMHSFILTFIDHLFTPSILISSRQWRDKKLSLLQKNACSRGTKDMTESQSTLMEYKGFFIKHYRSKQVILHMCLRSQERLQRVRLQDTRKNYQVVRKEDQEIMQKEHDNTDNWENIHCLATLNHRYLQWTERLVVVFSSVKDSPSAVSNRRKISVLYDSHGHLPVSME